MTMFATLRLATLLAPVAVMAQAIAPAPTAVADPHRTAISMLKPGGTLGVIDHHLPEGMNGAMETKSGYLKRSTVVRLAKDAGFRLAGESRINANPKDKHDWSAGVWTLPPTLQLGETDEAEYLAVGESDRMTLRFVQPPPERRLLHS